MSKAEKPANVFDIERIRQIIELMEQHDLCEVDLQQGEEKIKLNRGSTAPFYPAAPPMAAAAPQPAASPAAGESASGAADNAGTISINSPMVGTFYARPTPEAEAFVKVGQQVTEETIVCIVEAMKVFNEIPAECSGKVLEILANDGDPVDFGKPMFRLQPNA
jgi:acetyl-CoA carboxylase biotin carboxyl carrier protein